MSNKKWGVTAREELEGRVYSVLNHKIFHPEFAGSPFATDVQTDDFT